MAGDYRPCNGSAPLLLSLLAATLSVVLLPSMMPAVGATEQQPITIRNDSLFTSIGSGSDGRLAIARVQPELEGLETTTAMGSGVFSLQSSGEKCHLVKTSDINIHNKAGCGRFKPDQRYYCCTTDPNKGPINPQKCSGTTRDNPCH